MEMDRSKEKLWKANEKSPWGRREDIFLGDVDRRGFLETVQWHSTETL
jgi:hypothetical protein